MKLSLGRGPKFAEKRDEPLYGRRITTQKSASGKRYPLMATDPNIHEVRSWIAAGLPISQMEQPESIF